MSLKGYEFLDDNNKNKVVAMFLFKDLSLNIFEKITDEKLAEIKKYIKDNGFDTILKEEYFIKGE